MALDQHFIAIRERSYLEVLDLALRVIRSMAAPLAAAMVIGIGPVMAFNWWLLAGVAKQDFELGFPLAHMIYMTLLILAEVPLATAPLTLYLGQATFAERPRRGEVVRNYLRSLPQMLIYQVLLRLAFVLRTYQTEVIVLERNPMREGRSRRPTTGSRSRALHRGEGGELFVRSLLSFGLGAVLVASMWLSLYVLRSLLVGQWEWDRVMFTVFYPLTVWLVVGFFAVARFLSYLDLRIRREGWEVELDLRAERDRLMRNLA